MLFLTHVSNYPRGTSHKVLLLTMFLYFLSPVLGSKTEEYETPSGSLLSRHRTDFWSVIEALLIQDGPFLLVRLTVMMHFEIVHQMLVFFAIKNFLVVALNIYRLWVICWDSRGSQSNL